MLTSLIMRSLTDLFRAPFRGHPVSMSCLYQNARACLRAYVNKALESPNTTRSRFSPPTRRRRPGRWLRALAATELVTMVGHEVTVDQQPAVKVLVDGRPVATLQLGLSIEFDVNALVLGI